MHYKFLQFFILFFFTGGFINKSVSQTENYSDSIEILINQKVNNSVKQEKLIKLYNFYLKQNWTKAIETAEHSAFFFEKEKQFEYTVYWYTELGKIFLDQGLYLSSMVSLRDAEEICRENNINEGNVMLYIAKNFYLQGKYERSIKYYNNAFEQFELLKKTDKNNALKGISKTYNKLGIVYELKNNFSESENFYKKALDLRIKTGDTLGIIDSYTSLGYFYNVFGDYDTAIYYFNKGLSIKVKNEEYYHYFNDLHLFRSSSYLNKKEISKSYSDIDTAEMYAEKKQRYDLARVYYYYAKNDLAVKNEKKFFEHIEKSINYADTFNLVSLKLSALDLLLEVNIKKNNFKNAFRNLQAKNKITEEIYSEKLLNVEKSFELENKKRKILKLERTSVKLKEKNRIYIISILLSVVLLLLLTGFLFSDRKKNKKLTERKKYLETLFNYSPFGIIVTDNTGKIKDINKKLLDILGSPSLDETSELGNIRDIQNVKNIGFDKDLEIVNKTGQISDKEYDYVSYWKKKSVLRVVNVPLKNDKNEVYLIYSLIEDITKRKENEQTIRKLSEMVKQSTVSIVTTNKYGVIDYINPYFTKITGFSEKDALGKKLNILKSGLTPKETYRDLWETLKKNKAWKGEFINKTKSGKIYWESAIIFPLRNEKNEVVNYIGFLEDISEKKTMQELLEKKELKLKELNETKDKFFSIIAHDLKNPFGAILSLSDLLYKNYNDYDDEKKKKLIRAISEGAKNTYDLLENLLTWSRSQKGDIKFNPKKILLNKLISDNIKLLSDMALKKKISVFFESKEDIEVYADSNMINFVIRNLLTNAIKFTPKHGEIRFNIKNEKNYVEFCIKDTGIGMNTTQLNSLFEIDQTFSAKGTENETGTGLGLILCKDFIDFHKGKIRVQSELGKGSEFCIELPEKL